MAIKMYQANDGTLFRTLQHAVKHEKECELRTKLEEFFSEIDGSSDEMFIDFMVRNISKLEGIVSNYFRLE